MVQIIANHATCVSRRPGIQRFGLLPFRPTFGRPMGVYVYTDGDDFDHPTWGRTRGSRRIRWCPAPPQDVYRVAYVGRIEPDCYVENALIFLDSVPLENVTLVTRNRRCPK